MTIGLLLAGLPLDAPVLVMDLDAIEVEASAAAEARDRLIDSLRLKGLKPQTPREQVEAARAKSCRESADCLRELAKSQGADFLLAGSLGRVGGQLVLGVSLIDLRTSEVVARGGATDPTLFGLSGRIPEVCRQLLEPPERVVPTVPLPASPRFVILEFKGAGLPDERARNLIQVVATELRAIQGSTVLSRDEVQAMLGAEQLRSVLDASCDRSCFARLAGALDADYVVVGQVGLLDQTYVVNLTAIDQRTDGQARRVTETFEGSADELLRATRHATQSLFGIAAGTGQISVGASQNGARLYLNNEELGELPLPPRADLAPGRYAVKVALGGYDIWRTDVYVNPRDTSVVWADLQAQPEAWYQKWWVWTIVGVAVAGGAAGIAAASSGDSGVGTVTVGIR